MQSVSSAWTAEEVDETRRISQNTQISWHKESTLGNKTFTIGVSFVGDNDIIGINPGAVGSPGNYKYFDESDYVTSLSWERGLSMPLGGLTKGLAEINLDNTSNRFTPNYMGGNSELYTAQPLRSPVIINAGFNLGTDITIPQFVGLIDKQPEINKLTGGYKISASDYVGYFQNKYLDQNVMFTAQRTDQVLETILGFSGMNTAQYDLDTGINIIPFGLFEAGARFDNIINDLVQAENGRFYQDEEGIFRFENRQHYTSYPYTEAQRIITTAQVLNVESPKEDHLINVVEVKSAIVEKQSTQLIFQLSAPVLISADSDQEIFINFDDPILEVENITGFLLNTIEDGTGSDITSSLSVKSTDIFAKAAKIVFHNSNGSNGYLTQFFVYGRPAKKTSDLYVRSQDDSSVTAYQERPIVIENKFIQNKTWAESYARTILDDYSEIENLLVMTIRAIPELQLGDLISWQGQDWRIYDMKDTLNPNVGYIQELTLMQRNIATYFIIGVSTIGSEDQIAP